MTSPFVSDTVLDRRRPAQRPGSSRIVVCSLHIGALAVVITANVTHVASGIVVIAAATLLGTTGELVRLACASERWRHLALTDPLTDLPNRRAWAAKMSSNSMRARPCTLAIFDLDGFKSINDDHGHDVGDRMLVGVARALEDVLREHGSVYRIGGDEFCAIIDGPDDARATVAAACKAVQQLLAPLGASCSLGVAALPSDGLDAVAALRIADERMYRSKRSRRFARAMRASGRTAWS